jgi:hypothetical protein
MNLTEGTKGWFTPFEGGDRVRAEVIKVWGPQCVNLRCDDGKLPTSVLIKQDGCNGHFFEPDQTAEEPPMETMLQPKITGYRQLSKAEVDLMNEGKALAEQCGAYIAKLRKHGDSTRTNAGQGGVDEAGQPLLDQRWISMGATDLQRGFMAVTRGIAQPTTF